MGDVEVALLSTEFSKLTILDEHISFFSGTHTPVPQKDVFIGPPCLDLLASSCSCAFLAAKMF
jgi:hypothetical protein